MPVMKDIAMPLHIAMCPSTRYLLVHSIRRNKDRFNVVAKAGLFDVMATHDLTMAPDQDSLIFGCGKKVAIASIILDGRSS